VTQLHSLFIEEAASENSGAISRQAGWFFAHFLKRRLPGKGWLRNAHPWGIMAPSLCSRVNLGDRIVVHSEPFQDICFLLMALVFVVEGSDWPYRARLFPWTIGFPVVALLVWQRLIDLFSWPQTAPGVGEGLAQLADVQPRFSGNKRVLTQRAGEAFAWIFGLLCGVWILGFPLTIAVFCFFYLRFRSQEKWWVALTITLVLMAILYGFFYQVLHVFWPEGLLS
jgi:hypothetical protein